jgi:hypothetical protein
MTWFGVKNGTAPMGLVAEDFVLRAISKSISGERTFNPSLTMLKNLCQVMSGDISNVANWNENSSVVRADDKVVDINDYRDNRENPEENIIKKRMIEHFLCHLKARDAECASVAEQILLGPAGTSIELSISLGRSVSDVENIKKRLRRFCQDYNEQHIEQPARGAL